MIVTEAFIWSAAWAVILATGHYLPRARSSLGWTMGLFGQGLLLAFAIHTKQHGLVLIACLYIAIYWKNWAEWRRDRRKDEVIPA